MNDIHFVVVNKEDIQHKEDIHWNVQIKNDVHLQHQHYRNEAYWKWKNLSMLNFKLVKIFVNLLIGCRKKFFTLPFFFNIFDEYVPENHIFKIINRYCTN